MTATNDDVQQQLDEALAKNEELQAKLDQVTKHSRQWEERAKANKTAADELEQLKAEHDKTVKEADELRAWKQSTEAAQERTRIAQQVSEKTGVPADLLVGDDEESMSAYAAKLDQFAHPKPQGLPNQGVQLEPTRWATWSTRCSTTSTSTIERNPSWRWTPPKSNCPPK